MVRQTIIASLLLTSGCPDFQSTRLELTREQEEKTAGALNLLETIVLQQDRMIFDLANRTCPPYRRR